MPGGSREEPILGEGNTGKALRIAALAAVVIVLGGCAASQQMTAEDKAKYKTASMRGAVEKAPQSFLLAPGGANIGLMFGAIGGAVTGASMEDSQKAFDAYLVKNNISVENIVREEVEKVLRESGKLALGPAAPGVAELRVAVPQYGFGVTRLLGSKVVPVLWIKCDLVDPSGKLVWSANDRMLPSVASPMDAITWESMRDNPKVIEQEWRKAARFLALKIVGEL